jgi:hypothetical protein
MNAQPHKSPTNGEKTAVILTLADYEDLMEDLEDLAAIAERKDEPSIPFESVLNELDL